jgi:hypothetical protein
MDSGFGPDDGHNAYSKPLFADRGNANLYRVRAPALLRPVDGHARCCSESRTHMRGHSAYQVAGEAFGQQVRQTVSCAACLLPPRLQPNKNAMDEDV